MNKQPKRVNCFVVGAAKAGTTYLYSRLSLDPKIYAPLIKEPSYFSFDIDTDRFRRWYANTIVSETRALDAIRKARAHHIAHIKSKGLYEALYSKQHEQELLIDCSAAYLFSQTAAKNIFDYNPKAKIIIVLRDPLDRLRSHYQMDRRIGIVRDSLERELKSDMNAKEKGWGVSHLYVELGQYYEQVKRYVGLFPPDQVLILTFDDLVNHPVVFDEKLRLFLGLSEAEPMVPDENRNEARTTFNHFNYWLHQWGMKKLISLWLPRRLLHTGKMCYYWKSSECEPDIRLSAEMTDRLREIFVPDVEKLRSMLNMELGTWLRCR